MTLHVRDHWKEAFLTLPDGRTIFLKQQGEDVAELVCRQSSAIHPAEALPQRSVLPQTTVRKRIETILSERGRKLKIIPIGIEPQQLSLS